MESISSQETWTLVTRRNRRNHPLTNPSSPSQSQSQTLTLNPQSQTLTLNPQSQTLTLNPQSQSPSPWIPTGSPNPDQQSKLLLKMQSAILQLKNSQFLLRFLSRLNNPQIQQRLNNLLSSSPQIQIIIYGIGSIESYKGPRLQLALALLLKQELGLKSITPIEVFDPILTVVECAVLEELGCRVIDVNESGRRETVAPTIFYMPHCEAGLYDNLLNVNWKPAMLRWMVVLGNSFGFYQRYVDEMRGDCVSERRFLLGVRRFVKEVEMEEKGKNDGGFNGDEEEVEFFVAFHDMSWHFFEIDDDADMGGLCN